VTAAEAIAHYKKNKCFYLCDKGQRELFELIVSVDKVIERRAAEISRLKICIKCIRELEHNADCWQRQNDGFKCERWEQK